MIIYDGDPGMGFFGPLNKVRKLATKLSPSQLIVNKVLKAAPKSLRPILAPHTILQPKKAAPKPATTASPPGSVIPDAMPAGASSSMVLYQEPRRGFWGWLKGILGLS